MNSFSIDNKIISNTEPSFIIAEIGQAHDGSLGSAHSYIEAIAKTGVDAIKFQTHIASAESTRHETFRVKGFPQDKTRYDYWKRMEFSEDQWLELALHAKEVGLIFLSTPFSKNAVDILEKINVPAYKIGSGDVNNIELLEYVAKTNKPILLSSGMSTFKDIDDAVELIKKNGNDFCIFQCTTSYPCNPEDIGYNLLGEIKNRYNCHVGLSDHSGTIFPSLASIALGAKFIEVHSVFSKHSFGPDTSSSLELEEIKKLVDGVRFIEKGLRKNLDKDFISNQRSKTKKLFSRSAFYSADFKAGEIFNENSFNMKKPGGGMSFNEVKKLFGKKIIKDKMFDDFISTEDFS